MNASTGKTLGIVLLVLLGLMLLWPIRLLLLAPTGIVHDVFDGWSGFHVGRIHLGAWPWIGFAGLFGLAILALGIAILVWVYNDAERRGLSGALWVLLVVFLHFLGLIIYLIVRSSHPLRAPGQAAPAQGAPAAGATPPTPTPPPAAPQPPQPPACPQCGKPVAPAHAFCPTCGTKQ
jgi:hypothetical protein